MRPDVSLELQRHDGKCFYCACSIGRIMRKQPGSQKLFRHRRWVSNSIEKNGLPYWILWVCANFVQDCWLPQWGSRFSWVSPSTLVFWWKVELTQEKWVDWLGCLCVSHSCSSVDNLPEAFHETSCGRLLQRSLNHTPEERINTCRKSGQWKCDHGCKQRKQMRLSSFLWPKKPLSVLTLEIKVGRNKKGSGRIRIVLLSFNPCSTAETGEVQEEAESIYSLQNPHPEAAWAIQVVILLRSSTHTQRVAE